MTDLIYLVCVDTYMTPLVIVCCTDGGVWWDGLWWCLVLAPNIHSPFILLRRRLLGMGRFKYSGVIVLLGMKIGRLDGLGLFYRGLDGGSYRVLRRMVFILLLESKYFKKSQNIQSSLRGEISKCMPLDY